MPSNSVCFSSYSSLLASAEAEPRECLGDGLLQRILIGGGELVLEVGVGRVAKVVGVPIGEESLAFEAP